MAQLTHLIINECAAGLCFSYIETAQWHGVAELAAAPDRGPFVWPGASRASRAADFVRGALGMWGLADR